MPEAKDILRQFEGDLFAKHSGVEIIEVGPGFARGRLRVQDFNLNSVGITHGAAVFTLADTVFAVASNSHGQLAVAANVLIHFLKSTTTGDVLEATAREENRTKRLGLYRIEVRDTNGRTVALADGTVFIKDELLPVLR